MTQHKCPEIRELRSFVRCTLIEEQLESINDHLATCRTCEETVVGLEKNADTIAERIRNSPPIPFADEPECQQLLAAIQSGEFTTGRLHRDDQTVSPPLAVRDYQLLELLGKGGMGQVHRAVHQRLKRTVAIKLLSSARLKDQSAIARFEREMSVLGRLDHPHIVRAQDAGEHDGQHYLVMEYVDGLDLGVIVHRDGKLPIPEVCDVIRQAAIGLQYAHERGCVHRDIKPSNLMLAKTDGGAIVKILDLGLARALEENVDHGQQVTELTTANQIMGTLDYMAPEQGDDSHVVDIRADIYSLGATLYKLLTGEGPHAAHAGKPPLQRLLAMAKSDPPQIQSKRSEVPTPLASIVHRMLARDPKQRFPTPAEVATALEPFCQRANLARLLSPSVETVIDADGATAIESPRRDSDPPARRPRWLMMFWGAAAIVLLGVILQLTTRHGTIVVDCLNGELPPDVQLVISDSGNQVALLQADNAWTAKIVKGVFDVEVRQGSDRIQLETNQISLSRLGQAVVKVRLQPLTPPTSETRPAEQVVTTPAEDAASPTVFAVLREQKEPREFTDLAAALEILRPNDVVEIRGQGQIDIKIKEPLLFPLVLRAAKGHRPKLVFEELPLQGFGQDLTIEGCNLDVRKNQPHLPRVNAITLRRCRVWGYLHNLAGNHTLVEDSILVPTGGFTAGHLAGESSASVAIELRRTAIRCMESLMGVSDGRHSLKLEDCTVFAEDQGAPTLVSFGQDATAHVDIEATGCLFHCRSQSNCIIRREFLPQVTWSGRENCYSGDFYTVWEQDASGQYTQIKEKGLAAWNKLWPEPEIDSREVELVRFNWGAHWRTSNSTRKDAIKHTLYGLLSGRMNAGAGPDWSVIGAGNAYSEAIKNAGLNRDRFPQPLADGPIVILRQDHVVAGFSKLATAVAAALDGDIIEIRRSGAVAGCDITGENRLLTIRAGAGYEPSISEFHLRNMGTDRLILEGLRFDLPVHGSGGGSPPNWLGTDPQLPLFPGQGSIVRVQNCWVKSVLTGWMDAPDGQTPEIINCEIDRIEVGVRPGRRVAVRNSIFQTVVVNNESATSPHATLEMSRSVIWAPMPNRYAVVSAIVAPTPMHFDVSDCIFITPKLLVFNPHPQMTWTGNRNVYQASGGFNGGAVLDGLRAMGSPEVDSYEPIPFEFTPAAWAVVSHVSPDYEKRANGQEYGVNVEQLSQRIDAWYSPTP